ncbi:hypothetical protein A4D02_10615 [Niastella koreensis]|uniref:Uncharacterized protein n=2 Tax=Niastella koreensis TaxID=354356 RepID=G8T6Y1_NIAKG|nr:hypothetical protein [Niastella koreensis]AEV99002.1 hypothetical protein Niako_2663 [Niastella koreensis GR20-10]OQP43921.1 hypothetical protein A4D02_10615 [Niastella koreensis]
MHKGIIRLCYRKVIDVSSVKPWDKLVFNDTYTEFLLQSQFYNQEKKYTAFRDLITHVPAAEKLHFLVSAAVIGYLQQLQGRVPDLLNSLGRLFLPFNNYRFEIINSDIKDKAKHQVAISFFTGHLVWHDTINNQLLLSIPGNMENGEHLTELFMLPPFVSIYSIKPAAHGTTEQGENIPG